MVLKGTVINGTIVLDQPPAALAEGSRVEVVIKTTHEKEPGVTSGAPDPGKAASPLGEALMQLAGTAVGLPQDMAEQHDHYIHGTPKR